MGIRWRLGGLLLFTTGLLAAATAPCALACSCVPPQPLARSVDAQTAVVVGRIGPKVGVRYSFLVERWFTGPQPMAVLSVESGEMVLDDGTTMINTCGRIFKGGEHLVLVGGQSGDQLAVSSCSLGGNADAEDGRRLIAEAEALFGPGFAPEGETVDIATEPTSGGDPPASVLPIVLLGASGAGLAVLAVVAGVLLLRQRRRAD